MEKRIPHAELEVLAEGVDGRFYKVFRKWLLEDGRENQARRALLANPSEPTELARIQGNAEGLKGIHSQLKRIKKTYEQIEKEKKADKRSG